MTDGLVTVRASDLPLISDEYRERLRLAEDLKIEATKLDEPPRYESGKRVRCRGQRLSNVYWQGRQWAVTDYGVERRDGHYVIERNRLWDNEKDYGWVRHLAAKPKTDLEDFAEALRIARRRDR
jgi:hypothetical protein